MRVGVAPADHRILRQVNGNKIRILAGAASLDAWIGPPQVASISESAQCPVASPTMNTNTSSVDDNDEKEGIDNSGVLVRVVGRLGLGLGQAIDL